MNKEINKNHILILLASIFFLGMAATDIYIPSLPDMVKYFSSTPSTINLTLSAYTIGTGVFVLFADALSSYFGRRPIVIAAISIFIITSIAIGFSDSIWLVILLRFAQSSIGILFVVTRQISKDIMNQREQVRANAIMLSGLIISPAVSPVIGAFLAYHFGWRSCFVFTAIIGVLILLFAIKSLPETNLNRAKYFPKMGAYFIKYAHLAKNKLFIGLTTIYACSTASFCAFLGISSYLYIDKLGITPIDYSYVYIFMAVAYLGGNQLLLFLNKRECSYYKLITIGISLTLLGGLVTLYAYFVPTIIVIFLCVTIGSILMRGATAMTNPTTQVLTINYFKDDGGMALGLSMSINNIMMGVSVILVSLFEYHPLEGLIIVSLFFAFCQIAGFLGIRRKVLEL